MIHRAETPVFANQVYAKIYGHDTPEDILRVENIFQEIIAPEDPARLYHYFQCRLRGEPAPTHYICLHRQEGGLYSWWDYRALAFQRNLGFRIDHILVTPPLAARCTTVTLERALRKRPKPSDHIPVVATFSET